MYRQEALWKRVLILEKEINQLDFLQVILPGYLYLKTNRRVSFTNATPNLPDQVRDRL